MNVPTVLEAIDARISRAGTNATRFLRVGFGLTLLPAGTHQFLNPADWHRYLAPQIASMWPTGLLPLDPVFSLFGATEVLVGLLVLGDWHVPTLASLSGLYLLGVVANLALAILAGEPFGDVMMRDIGLALFAFGTALETAKDASRTTSQTRSSAG